MKRNAQKSIPAVYGMSFAGTETRIRGTDLLELATRKGRADVAAQVLTLANGIRYSGQDFDVLSAAFSALSGARTNDKATLAELVAIARARS